MYFYNYTTFILLLLFLFCVDLFKDEMVLRFRFYLIFFTFVYVTYKQKGVFFVIAAAAVWSKKHNHDHHKYHTEP